MTASSGISLFLMVFGGFFLLWGLVMYRRAVRARTRLQSYQAGQCRIVAKRLLEHRSSSPGAGGLVSMTSTPTYTPQFDFLVLTPDGRQYEAQGYESLSISTQFPGDKQAILDLYTVGEVYPCWYDPADPTQAVLTPEISPWRFFFPIPFLLIGGIAALFGAISLIFTLI